jgi:hypothetical protein
MDEWMVLIFGWLRESEKWRNHLVDGLFLPPPSSLLLILFFFCGFPAASFFLLRKASFCLRDGMDAAA